MTKVILKILSSRYVVANSVQLERLPRVIFKDENDIRHVVTDPGAKNLWKE